MKEIDHRTTVVTVTTRNYFHRARVLMEALGRFAPDLSRVVYCVDDLDGFLDDAEKGFTVVNCGDIGVQCFGKFKLALNPTAMCCVLKPHIALHAMRHLGATEVIYIDNDVGIYREPSELIEAARIHPLVLTPHFLGPMPAGSAPDEFRFKPYGIYNAGIFAARNVAQAIAFLEWWARWMETPGHVIENWGYDQTWLDHAHVFCEGTYILRDLGYNVAFWNLAERGLSIRDGIYFCDNVSLAAFHFSGIDESRPELLVRYKNGCTQPLSDATRKLGRDITNAWSEAGRTTCLEWGYAYAVWPDGASVLEAERNWLVRRWSSVKEMDFFDSEWASAEPNLSASLKRARFRSKLAKSLPAKIVRKICSSLARFA